MDEIDYGEDSPEEREEYLKLLEEKGTLESLRLENRERKNALDEVKKTLNDGRRQVLHAQDRPSDQFYDPGFLEWYYKKRDNDQD